MVLVDSEEILRPVPPEEKAAFLADLMGALETVLPNHALMLLAVPHGEGDREAEWISNARPEEIVVWLEAVAKRLRLKMEQGNDG